MNISRHFFLFFLFVVSPSVVAEIYQWRDENGKLHFSDSPPPEAKAEKKELQSINVGDSLEIDHDAIRRSEHQKNQKKKTQQEKTNPKTELAQKCKALEKEYIDLKWGKSHDAEHTVLTRNGKAISRREQNEIAEKFRQASNRRGCNIPHKEW